MADVKFSALSTMAALDGTEKLVGLQGGAALVGTPAQINTYVRSLMGTGISTFLNTPTSANLAASLTDETGSGGGGVVVFNTSPTLVTPVLGVASATSINKVAITAPATSATLTLIDGTTITGPAITGTLATLGANIFTGAQTLPNGTNAVPSLNFGDAPSACYRPASNRVAVTLNSGLHAVFEQAVSGFTILGGYGLGLSNTGTVSSANVSVIQPSANRLDIYQGDGSLATIQIGINSATPTAWTLRGPASRAGTDSDVGGAGVSIAAGLGTGTGTLSSLLLKSPVAVASGTGAQTSTIGLTIKAGAAILTNYAVADLPAAATVGAGGRAFVTDAFTTIILGFGGTVTGGGANKVPVYSDGTNWIYG